MEGGTAKGYLSVVAAALMWASSGTAGKALFGTGITPFDLVQVRVTVSTALLALVFGLWSRGLFRIRRADIAYFCILGVVMAAVQVTYFYSISKIQVAAAIFLQYLSPLVVALFSILFLKERVTAVKTTALGLSLLGSYLVVGAYRMELLEMHKLGILVALLSACCFAGYSLLGEKGMHRYSPWTVLFYAVFFAAICWHLFYAPFKYLYAGYSLNQWVWMTYISIVGTLLPFGLYFVGVNYIRSTRASITATLEPISAGFIAYAVLGEGLEPLQVVGGAVVVGGIVLLQVQREQDALTPELVRSRVSGRGAQPL
jgi:drug/metabolite transporter (DMT)-like permease